MNKFFAFILIIVLIHTLFSQVPFRDFEIVESIPVETNLDNEKIRNTSIVWLEMINSATRTIDIEQFYISNQKDEALEPIIKAIEKQAQKGIKIRIIVENNMADTYPETLKRLNKQKNIIVKTIKIFHQTHGIQHSKFFIIDEEKVFIGSQNFDWRALDHIHEIGLSINHPKYAMAMTDIFELDWEQCDKDTLITILQNNKTEFQTHYQNETIYFFPTASPYKNIPEKFISDEKAIIDAINNANTRICIQLLSYSPSAYKTYYSNLDNAIRNAAIRGVKVNLLVSDWCQKKYEMPYLKSLSVLPNITVKLSTIPEYSKKYIPFARVEHCKFMVVDNNISWVGTSNWKKNYFYNSRNLGLIIKSPLINGLLYDIFQKSWSGSYSRKVEPEKNYQPKEYGDRN